MEIIIVDSTTIKDAILLQIHAEIVTTVIVRVLTLQDVALKFTLPAFLAIVLHGTLRIPSKLSVLSVIVA